MLIRSFLRLASKPFQPRKLYRILPHYFPDGSAAGFGAEIRICDILEYEGEMLAAGPWRWIIFIASMYQV
jgi:hypothetical protein